MVVSLKFTRVLIGTRRTCSGTTGRVFATCVSRAHLFLAISNEIAGDREAALILIQIVLARTIRRYHMSQGRNVAATLVVITSPSASELDRQRHMAKLQSGRSDSADSAPRDRGCGPAPQSRTSNRLPSITTDSLTHTMRNRMPHFQRETFCS